MRHSVLATLAATASACTSSVGRFPCATPHPMRSPTLHTPVHAPLRTPPPPVALAPLTFAASALSTPLGSGLALNSVIATLAIAAQQRVLTPEGLLHAWALGVILWSTLGLRGWATCVIYLIGGSAVTKLGKAKKEALGIAEGRGGARGPENVWGSAATAALCALASIDAPPVRAFLLRVGFVASLATKLADTFASEVGKAYGKTTYLITTLRRVPPGTEGAVSAEGTAAGVVGSVILGGVGICAGMVPMHALLPIALAAFIANNVESLIGATAQGKVPWLTNEVVNFVNTLVGAIFAVALAATGFA